MNLDDKRGFNIDTNGLRGNAWTMGDNMVASGKGQRLYNMFGLKGAPRERDRAVTTKYVNDTIKSKEYKESIKNIQFRPGDLVELFYYGTSDENFYKAYDKSKGNNQHTHAGDIVERGGTLYVRDNMHGKYHYRKLDNVINGKDGKVVITGVVTPEVINEENGKVLSCADMSDIGITRNEEFNETQKGRASVRAWWLPSGYAYFRNNSEATYRAMKTIASNKDVLQAEYNLTDEEFNMLTRLTYGAGCKETVWGYIDPNGKYSAEINENNSIWENLGRGVGATIGETVGGAIRTLEREFGKAFNPNYSEFDENGDTTSITNIIKHNNPIKEVSRGLTNVKPDFNFTQEQQKELPISAVRKEQPEASGLLGFIALTQNYNRFKELLKDDKNDNSEILEVLTAISHNQNNKNIITNIKKYLETGDRNEIEQYKDFGYWAGNENQIGIKYFLQANNFDIIQPENTKRPDEVEKILAKRKVKTNKKENNSTKRSSEKRDTQTQKEFVPFVPTEINNDFEWRLYEYESDI